MITGRKRKRPPITARIGYVAQAGPSGGIEALAAAVALAVASPATSAAVQLAREITEQTTPRRIKLKQEREQLLAELARIERQLG